MQTDPNPSVDTSPAGAPQDTGAAAAAHAARQTPRRARPAAMIILSHPAHIVSLGFGSGLSPIMPGTVGTLFAWLSFVALDHYLSPAIWAAVIVVGFVAGIGLSGFTARRLGVADPSPVVWDEIVAFWLVLLFVTPATFTAQAWAFVLFRFFDMVKPPPVGYFDRHFKGGFGIMVDDLAAAFMTLLVIAIWRAHG